MGLCLGYETALRYWLTKRGDEALPDGADSGVFAHTTAGRKRVLAERLPVTPEQGKPLHLVVPDRRLGHRMEGIVAHVWSTSLPAGSLCRLSGDNLIASPAFTFVQMAASKTLIQTVEIGCYLCSTFAITDMGREYVGERRQLVNLEELRRYVESLPPRVRGARRARAALGYVVENLASPMEVFLGMEYGLPPELGGQGPLTLWANRPIALNERLQEFLGSTHLRGDLYLADYNLDLEYDSYEYHTGRYRLDHTQARRNALETMGIKTISATYGQVNTYKKFESFSWMLRERAGIEHPETGNAERQAQAALYEMLTSPNHRLF